MVIRIALLCFLAFNTYGQEKRIKSVEIFNHSLQAATAEAVHINDISDTSRFLMECSHPYLINALSSFEKSLMNRRPAKRNLLGDYRILVVLIYSDGSKGYLGATTIPYIEYNGKVYKDEEYQFLKLVNIYISIKTLEIFLKDHKLVDPNLTPQKENRICN